MKTILRIIPLLAVFGLASAFAQDMPADNMEILRDKVSADKKLLVAINMGLTESEAAAFWPLYDEYQLELESLNERIGSLIESYADGYVNGTLDDDKAAKLINEMLDIENDEVALKKKIVPKLERDLPAIKVARYLQIENKIRALIKYELTAEVPLAELISRQSRPQTGPFKFKLRGEL